ncbi:hypothetical protein ACRAWF_37245 [Streptomyces sp. L7]
MLGLLKQLELMTEEIHRANLIQQYRITVDQMNRTIDDPSLADASSTLTGLTEGSAANCSSVTGSSALCCWPIV